LCASRTLRLLESVPLSPAALEIGGESHGCGFDSACGLYFFQGKAVLLSDCFAREIVNPSNFHCVTGLAVCVASTGRVVGGQPRICIAVRSEERSIAGQYRNYLIANSANVINYCQESPTSGSCGAFPLTRMTMRIFRIYNDAVVHAIG
jgi:hypothetical protein